MDWPTIAPLITPAIILAMMAFGWQVSARIEDRLTANANLAHAQIGKNIERLEGRIDKLDERTHEDLVRIEAKLPG